MCPIARFGLIALAAGCVIAAQAVGQSATPDADGGAGAAHPWLAEGKEAGHRIIGPNGMPLVWVPGGELRMGLTAEEAARVLEDLKAYDPGLAIGRLQAALPARRVRISKGFWLGACEVTGEQFARFLNDCGAAQDHEGKPLVVVDSPACPIIWQDGQWRPKLGRERYPMTAVTWYGARAYAEFYGLRLPTEAEWEWAARGPEQRLYPWGQRWDTTQCRNAHHLGPGPWGHGEVGTLEADISWCGALDMAGNVREWVRDGYSPEYLSKLPVDEPAVDPCCEEPGERKSVRGGFTYVPLSFCCVAMRDGEVATAGAFGCGFRVCVRPKKGPRTKDVFMPIR